MDHTTFKTASVVGIIVGVLFASWMLLTASQRQAASVPTVQAEWRCDPATKMCREVPK